MSREEGFSIMDVSTSICDDPKFRRIAREHPELVGTVFTAYVATMAESWRVGRRANVDDAWPAILPYSAEAVAVMVASGLLDKRGALSPKAWRRWFEPARSRRDKSRADWRRWQAEHRKSQGNVSTDSEPDKAKPSAPPVRPPDPTDRPPPRATRGSKNDGLEDPPTKEEARRLEAERLHEEHKAGRLTDFEYASQRKALGAA